MGNGRVKATAEVAYRNLIEDVLNCLAIHNSTFKHASEAWLKQIKWGFESMAQSMRGV
jgi:hypothetical protein